MTLLEMFDYHLLTTYGQVTNREVQAKIQKISSRILTLEGTFAVFIYTEI